MSWVNAKLEFSQVLRCLPTNWLSYEEVFVGMAWAWPLICEMPGLHWPSLGTFVVLLIIIYFMEAPGTEQRRLWLTTQRCLCHTCGLGGLRSGCHRDGGQLRPLGWFVTAISCCVLTWQRAESRRHLSCSLCKDTDPIRKVLSLGSNSFLMAPSPNTFSLGIRIPVINSVTRPPIHTTVGSASLWSMEVHSYNACLLYWSFTRSRTKSLPSNYSLIKTGDTQQRSCCQECSESNKANSVLISLGGGGCGSFGIKAPWGMLGESEM